jgi:hypothetical protein
MDRGEHREAAGVVAEGNQSAPRALHSRNGEPAALPWRAPNNAAPVPQAASLGLSNRSAARNAFGPTQQLYTRVSRLGTNWVDSGTFHGRGMGNEKGKTKKGH